MKTVHEHIETAADSLRVASIASESATPRSSSEIGSIVIEPAYTIEWLDTLLAEIDHKLIEADKRGGVIVNHESHGKTTEETVNEASMLLTKSGEMTQSLFKTLMLCVSRLSILRDTEVH